MTAHTPDGASLMLAAVLGSPIAEYAALHAPYALLGDLPEHAAVVCSCIP
jgi:hypothetical protein